ncbi:MAG: hypothetical protein QXQ43_00645 [Nitrososphaerota archaeon]
MKVNNQIVKFESNENGDIKIVARSSTKLNDGDNSEIYSEDAVYFSPKTYVKYMLIRAILYGVPVESSTVMFSEDEYKVEITEDGEIKISITPNKDSSKLAFNKLVERILTDIHMASRTMSTTAIRRSSEKLGVNQAVKYDADDNMAKIEESMYIESRRIKVFEIAKSKNIPIVELQNKSIELTGKKSSAKWTIEDIEKMTNFVNSYQSNNQR